MFSLTSSSRYYLYQRHVNMGKGINGLFNLVRSEMNGLSPVSGDVFVFFSKNRRSVKLLKWDGDGFLLYYKRLERGSFAAGRTAARNTPQRRKGDVRNFRFAGSCAHPGEFRL